MEAAWYCDDEPSVCAEVCGDGYHAGYYECDDGNNISGDGYYLLILISLNIDALQIVMQKKATIALEETQRIMIPAQHHQSKHLVLRNVRLLQKSLGTLAQLIVIILYKIGLQ